MKTSPLEGGNRHESIFDLQSSGQAIHMKKAIAAIALFALTFSAQAYEFQFTGRVTYTDGTLINVTDGALLQGHFLADGPANYSIPDGTTVYSFASGQVVANVAGYTISGSRPSIAVIDDFGGNVEDGFNMNSGYPIIVNGASYENGDFGFKLATRPGNTEVIRDHGLPSLIDVSAFDGHSSLNYGFLQRDGGQSGAILAFEVLSITVVPEPSTAWLFAAGLLAVAPICRRRMNG
jgi:hypothetical protein